MDSTVTIPILDSNNARRNVYRVMHYTSLQLQHFASWWRATGKGYDFNLNTLLIKNRTYTGMGMHGSPLIHFQNLFIYKI